MTTQEVADKLVQLCREGKYLEAYDLYARDAVSLETPGVLYQKIEGRDNIIEVYNQWADSVREYHGGSVGNPVVTDDHFMVRMCNEATFEGLGRRKIDVLCFYQVADGKIKKASFFYDPSVMMPGN